MFRLVTKADRLANRAIYLPKNRPVHCVTDTDAAAAYVYKTEKGHVTAVCFAGSAGRPEIHCTYADIDRATSEIARFLLGITASQTRKTTERAERKAWKNPLTVGTILYTAWGYDQTNVDFYVVTRVSGKRTWVRAIAQDSETTGFMSGNCWPRMPIQMTGEESMHVAQPSGKDGVHLNIRGHHASVETGRSHGWSSYA